MTWDTKDLPERLAEHLSGTRPAKRRRGFAPEMSYGRHQGPPGPDARHASVMILLYHDERQWKLPLTLRQSHLAAHPNQISLPGGSVDAGESSLQAAVREVGEELGFCCQPDEVLGRLEPLFVFNSNFIVQPWVGWSAAKPKFSPNQDEVAQLIQIPLHAVTDVNRFGTHLIRRGDMKFEAPSIQWQEHCIWGATRIVLADLADCLQEMAHEDLGAC